MTKTALLSNEIVMKDWLVPQVPPNFNTFNSEEDLIVQIERMLTQDSLREQQAVDMFEDIRIRHLPEHRAAQLVDFITRSA